MLITSIRVNETFVTCDVDGVPCDLRCGLPGTGYELVTTRYPSQVVAVGDAVPAELLAARAAGDVVRRERVRSELAATTPEHVATLQPYTA